jgi:hypothetical protein
MLLYKYPYITYMVKNPLKSLSNIFFIYLLLNHIRNVRKYKALYKIGLYALTMYMTKNYVWAKAQLLV